MKQWITVLIASLLSVTAFAQKPKSSVRFSMTDGSPIVITINDRDYQKVGTSLVVSDLPRKRHSVRIYKFRPYADGQGGKAEIVYVGNIKIEPGNKYDAILNATSGKLNVRQVKQFEQLPFHKTPVLSNDADFKPYREQPPVVIATEGISESTTFELPKNNETDLAADVLSLKTKMQKEVKDGEKLKLAKDFVSARKVTTAEAKAIINWINFDDNKLAFAQHAKSRLSDPQNAKSLAEELTYSSSKETYLKGL